MADFILDEPHLMDEDGGFAIANGGKAGAQRADSCAIPYAKRAGTLQTDGRVSVRKTSAGRTTLKLVTT